MYLSETPVEWNDAFKNCSQDQGRLYSPRYFQEWQDALAAFSIEDNEVFWTGLVMNDLGLVTSSYGEMMTKLFKNDTNGVFLPNDTLTRQQLQTGLGQLKASSTQFVVNSNLELRYLCEYIGKYKIQTYYQTFLHFCQFLFR